MSTRLSDKEKKIIEYVKETTGITPPIANITEEGESTEDLLSITDVLVLSSSYHYFQIEEEGRLSRLLHEYYSYRNREKPLRISHVETEDECFELLNKKRFDLIIIFDKPTGSDVLTLAGIIRKNTDTPIILIGSKISELSEIQKNDKEKVLSKILTWNGDGKIILATIQLFDDAFTIKNNQSFSEQCRCLLLIEDSIQYYSTYLLLLYDEIWGFLSATMQDNLSEEQIQRQLKRRPVILHASDFEEGRKLYDSYKKNLIGVITDNETISGTGGRKQLGLEFALMINKEKPGTPILIQSSGVLKHDEPLSDNIKFISKNDITLPLVIKDFINECLGPRYIQITDSTGKIITVVKNFNDLENAVLSINDEGLIQAACQHLFSRCLKTWGLYELSDEIYKAEFEIKNAADLRTRLTSIIENYRYAQTQVLVKPFEYASQLSHLEIHRIGKGALGGKARGLSFLAKLISKYISDDMFPDLRITIPRTIVLTTDVFDIFMMQNKLYDSNLYDLTDERIALKFMSGTLPATVLGDLRAFIQKTRKPLIVRSSGVLEDSLLQSFAGIYDSILLPNESWETDFRFQDVCNAVKYVYASTFFEKARTYIKSTPKNIGDEKMAVIIQEVAGRRYENYFYPVVSGVAKSYNYYPAGGCKPEDGVVYLALGLGKTIVDGGCSFCFCPEHPTVPLYGTPKDFIKYAQRRFYALNLRSNYRIVERNEETSYSILDLDDAKRHGVLDKVASTYFPQDDRLYPGVYDEGSIVIDFAPIIQYEALPLAKALKLLLRISEIELGYPVEIEFAVNQEDAESHKADLIILQIRSMIPSGKNMDVSIGEYNPETDICYSENALGNGVIEGIQNIVYVKPGFDMKNSIRVVSQIRRINNALMNNKTPYILIGPGRWGSADPCLGIPVIWSDIAGTKVIVETPWRERHIDPSQGSHFFHDLISSQVGYLITKEGKGNVDYQWLESLPVITDEEDVRHVKTISPLLVKIDGKHGVGVIQKGKSDK